MKHASLALMLAGVLAILSGCGGGTAGPTGAQNSSRGSLSIDIHWPRPGRLVPSEAKSIIISVAQTGETTQVQQVGSGTPTATFTGLAVGAATLTAVAYTTAPPNPSNPTVVSSSPGVAVAKNPAPGGATSVQILPGPAVTQAPAISLDTTISQIVITPRNASVQAGQTTTLAATPEDAAGNMVLVSSAYYAWSSLDSSVAQVVSSSITSSGDQVVIKGITAGNATIQVSDTEWPALHAFTSPVVVTANPAFALAQSPWPKNRSDLRNTGRGGAPGATGTVVKWSNAPGGTGITDSSPTIGTVGAVTEVIVGSDPGNVIAYNAVTGAIIWTFKTGGVVESSPTWTAGGVVYIGSDDDTLYALNAANGAVKWSFKAAGPVKSSPTIASDGTVYAGADDGNLYALDPSTGTKKWQFHTGGLVASSPAIAADNTIYFGSNDKYLYALTPRGSVKWKFHTNGPITASPSVGDDGTIYVGSYDGKFYAVTPAGAQKWAFTSGASIESSAAVGYQGQVYFGSDDFNVYCLNGATGAAVWSAPFVTGFRCTSSPVVATDGTVYECSDDHNLYALNGATGVKLWAQLLGDIDYSNPAVATDGTIYIGMDRGFFAVR